MARRPREADRVHAPRPGTGDPRRPPPLRRDARVPGMVLGATPHHAWGATNVTGDVQDLYEERFNDEGTAALHGDAWEPLTVHEELIGVRGEEPRVVTVRETRHGPILTHGTAGILH